jgi:hypothetical protein
MQMSKERNAAMAIVGIYSQHFWLLRPASCSAQPQKMTTDTISST